MNEDTGKVSKSIQYWRHFEIIASLSPYGGGLLIHVVFVNNPLPGNQLTPRVVILFPINGYLEYYYRTSENVLGIIVGQIHDVSVSEPNVLDYLIPPGRSAYADFYIRIPMEHMVRMKEIADIDGVIVLDLHLYFSIQYGAGGILAGQKIYKLHPIFEFSIPKAIFENWVAQWMKFHTQFIDLPPTVPEEVLSDYIEAVKSFYVGAYKATIAMARRALQQALEHKGATRGKRLIDQINELQNKGIIDKATATLSHGIRQFGNYGAHPQTDLLSQVTSDDAKLVIAITRKN